MERGIDRLMKTIAEMKKAIKLQQELIARAESLLINSNLYYDYNPDEYLERLYD